VINQPDVCGYDILSELGAGGMGCVYLASRWRDGRLVAIKVPRLGSSAEMLARFNIERQTQATLKHPNIVPVIENGTCTDGRPFLVQEYLPGGNLAERARPLPWPSDRAARLVEILARAIQDAHDRGVLHRDMKPSNILFDAADVPHITDFGLSRVLGSPGSTREGQMLGSPAYMAPEQARANPRAFGPATDVYGLGAVLYFLLTGEPPFWGDGPVDTAIKVISDPPIPPTRLNAGCPSELERICLTCLAKDPGQRYPSALSLAEALRRFLESDPLPPVSVGCPPSGVHDPGSILVRR
jgi:eukaryotic-like serine/threonine-protein kinase